MFTPKIETFEGDSEAAKVGALVADRILRGAICHGPFLPEVWRFTESGRSVKVRFEAHQTIVEVK